MSCNFCFEEYELRKVSLLEGLLPTPRLLVSGGRLWCSSLRAHAVTVGTSTRSLALLSQICQNALKQRTRDPTHSPYPHGRILMLIDPRSVQIQCRESPELSVFRTTAFVKELKWVASQNCARVRTKKALLAPENVQFVRNPQHNQLADAYTACDGVL